MNSKLIFAQQEIKVEECLLDVQQQLDVSYSNRFYDQSSFTKIHAFLDQVCLAPDLIFPHQNINIALPVVQIQPLIQTLANQIIQEVKPIINLTMNQQIKQNRSQLQQQLTKLQSQQIQQHKQKDSTTNYDNQLNLNSFTYNLLQNNLIQQNQFCRVIAINKDNTIVLAGCQSQIKVFEFKQEQLKQTQLITEHQYYVITLNFMKKQNQFISGDENGLIIIWSMNQNSQWILQLKLKEHSNYINCLVISNSEDLFISGSDDKTIKFWQKQNQWLCSQTITDHSSYVLGLSMNDQQNRVISCGEDKLILIIERSSQDSKWIVIQKISVQQYGNRLCVINDNVFTFQPRNKEQMHVYELSSTNKQYSMTKQIAVKSGQGCHWWFPQQYIKQKCLLVYKNGHNINLIRMNRNADFITQQSIDFGHHSIFGQMSEDGNYLITWDDKSSKSKLENIIRNEYYYQNYSLFIQLNIQNNFCSVKSKKITKILDYKFQNGVISIKV